jgi:hypothetical protein
LNSCDELGAVEEEGLVLQLKCFVMSSVQLTHALKRKVQSQSQIFTPKRKALAVVAAVLFAGGGLAYSHSNGQRQKLPHPWKEIRLSRPKGTKVCETKKTKKKKKALARWATTAMSTCARMRLGRPVAPKLRTVLLCSS